MITRNRTKTVLTLVAVTMAILGLTATQANARLVVEEQFAYEILDPDGVDTQTPLNGLDSGIGFDGAWTATQSHGRLLRVGLLIFAGDEPLTFNDDRGLHFTDVNGDELPVAGAAVSRYGAAGRAQTDRLLSAESQAALTRDNTTIWFSALAGGSSNNTNSFFLFGTDPLIHTDIGQIAAPGQGFGFNISGPINALAFNNTINSMIVEGTYTQTLQEGSRHYDTSLIVGKINWKPNGTPDEFFLFNVTDMSKQPDEADAIASITNLDFDQSAFDTVTYADGAWGVIDEIRFGNAFANVMGVVETGNSSDPSPADGATEVLRDVVLNWTPGEFTAAVNGHTVYLSESFDDVNDGIGGITQSTASYSPTPRSEFGTTYYWRVEEIGDPPDSTVYPGEVWSFTTELFAYPIENVIATASSSIVGEGAENTVNDSGLDANDLHSADPKAMWISEAGDPGSASIQYEFDKPYKLHEMFVWNYNGDSILALYGLKEVTIEYSTDGTNFSQLENVPEFAQAIGEEGYAANTTVAFNGAAAKYVKITANSNWGGGGGFFNKYGLSEVRFTAIPVSARKPSPDSGATGVDVDVILGWQAGREAVSHDVYVSADPNALIFAGPVTEPAFGTTSLDLALNQTYHWRIDEVNDAEPTTTWQGDIWSFTTQEYRVVEDFESYNDIDPPDPESHTIFGSWSDGYLTPATNGALVGYEPAQPPSRPSYMEHTIVYDGDQSMPLSYNNTIASYSEASVNTDDLAIGRDWSKGSPTTMLLRFYGDPNNAVTEQLYVKIGDTRFDYPGDVAALAEPRWSEWPIDLTDMDLSNVPELAIGFERLGGVGGQGTVMIDAVWLNAAPTMVPIFVPDAGFDDQVLGAGGYTYVGVGNYDGEALDYPGPWQSAGGDAWIHDHYYADGLPARSGQNQLYGYEENEDYVYQTLDETFIEGVTYTLSVWVGQAWSDEGVDWQLYFFTEENHQNNLIETSGIAPVGSWEQVSLVYTATAADAGNKIGIKMKGDPSLGFEDVTLFHSSDE